MKYKLIDVKEVSEDDVQFGTCELCMHVGTLSGEEYIVQDEKMETFVFESGYWDWGDYMQYSWETVTNVVDFADWFSKQDLQENLSEQGFWSEYDRYIEEVQEV